MKHLSTEKRIVEECDNPNVKFIKFTITKRKNMYQKFIIKLKQFFCKHDWDYCDNGDYWCDFTLCSKCDKQIWHDEHLKQ